MAHRLPKALGIYLRVRRSGELRCVRAGALGKYLARHRKYDRFASTRTDINGKQTHDDFFASRFDREGAPSKPAGYVTLHRKEGIALGPLSRCHS